MGMVALPALEEVLEEAGPSYQCKRRVSGTMPVDHQHHQARSAVESRST